MKAKNSLLKFWFPKKLEAEDTRKGLIRRIEFVSTKENIMEREVIQEMFKRNDRVRVVFTKKDGTDRVMNCTTNFDLIPKEFHPVPLQEGETPRNVNPDVHRVFDLDINQWRSFRYDSVKEIGTINV